AHALMDSLARVPGIPAGLAEAVSPQQR
ncbi:TetR/AcrR family transcriptional regulator, partial [Mycobacterium sp. ITM-2017-0098]